MPLAVGAQPVVATADGGRRPRDCRNIFSIFISAFGGFRSREIHFGARRAKGCHRPNRTGAARSPALAQADMVAARARRRVDMPIQAAFSDVPAVAGKSLAESAGKKRLNRSEQP